MPITTKTVKRTRYLYFIYYDPKGKGKKEIYCGAANDPKAQQKAQELERKHLQQQISSLESQLQTFQTVTTKSRKKRRVIRSKRLSEKDLKALEAIKNAEIYEPEVYYKSSEQMEEVEDNSVQLIVTSPPYNVGKNYSLYYDKKEIDTYLSFINRVWKECKRVLCKGGRIAVNVADTWRQPYIPLHALIIQQFLDLGMLMRGVIYWDKGASVGVSTAWGSWRSASNPTLRDVGEYLLIFCKDSFKLHTDNKISTISPEQFTLYTKSLWSFSAVDTKEGHPAIFPDELPKRLIQLYTFLGDTVLDPFLGSGTTCKVAKAWGRKSVGYEIDESYRPIIEKKIGDASALAIPLETLTINGKPYPLEGFAPIQIARNSDTKSSS